MLKILFVEIGDQRGQYGGKYHQGRGHRIGGKCFLKNKRLTVNNKNLEYRVIEEQSYERGISGSGDFLWVLFEGKRTIDLRKDGDYGSFVNGDVALHFLARRKQNISTIKAETKQINIWNRKL